MKIKGNYTHPISACCFSYVMQVFVVNFAHVCTDVGLAGLIACAKLTGKRKS